MKEQAEQRSCADCRKKEAILTGDEGELDMCCKDCVMVHIRKLSDEITSALDPPQLALFKKYKEAMDSFWLWQMWAATSKE